MADWIECKSDDPPIINPMHAIGNGIFSVCVCIYIYIYAIQILEGKMQYKVEEEESIYPLKY